MATLRIWCLGDFRVELDGEILSSFDTEKSRALLAYLAVDRGRPLRRSHLAGLLWPDEPETKALHNLRQTLSSLRKVLRENPSSPFFIGSDRESIQLSPTKNIWVDTLAFTHNLEQAYRNYQRQGGKGLVNIRALLRALELYQGPFLSQFEVGKSTLFEEWAAITREGYRLQAIKALALAAAYYERREEYHLAYQAANRLVKLCPWDESARAQVIRLLGIDQQWSAAQSQYFDSRKYLSEQLGLSPSSELEQLYRDIRIAASGKRSISPTFPPSRNNLPDSTTQFVGRETEMDEVMERIVNSETKLITLSGPGGVGKTRLALEIAHQATGIFADGVFFVVFTMAQKPEQISELIANAIGLVFSEQSDPRQQLIDHLRGKEMLLVMDNFEHLLPYLGSTQVFDEILTRSSRVHLLVTSRERLNLRQEWTYALGGLNFPIEANISLEAVETYDALLLFARRAVQLQRDFVINETNLPAIIQICNLLEGVPLGVELAASAMWEQGYEAVAERMETDLDVLNTPFTNIIPRHRSLRAAFDVSWDLLTAREQQALAGLSVFRGGFGRRAALEVAGASSALLSTLVSKSLLSMEEGGRFYTHEIIRQFANEKMVLLGISTEIQARHAQWYVSFLSENSGELKSAGQMAALAAIQREIGNINEMWNWLVKHKQSAGMLRCTTSLYQFFRIRNNFTMGMQWFDQGIHCLQNDPAENKAVGRLMALSGSLAYMQRENALAQKTLSQAQKILAAENALEDLAFCHVQLGWLFQREKDFLKAEDYAQKSLAYYEDAGDNLGKTDALILLGSQWNRQGDNVRAAAFFAEALRLGRKTGNPRQMVSILNRLGDIACFNGEYPTAIQQFSESLEITRSLNDRFQQAILLNNLGTIYHIWQDYPSAQEHYQKSMEICQEIGDQDGVATALSNLGELATGQDDFVGAIHYSESALEIAEQLQEKWTIIACLNTLGEIYCAMAQYNLSKDYFLKALRLATESQAMDLVGRVSVNLARTLQLLGEERTAISLYQAALAHPSTEHDSREKAIGWLNEVNAPAEGGQETATLSEIVHQLLQFLAK